jgi:tRNA (cmo5U34)-methyltransferase
MTDPDNAWSEDSSALYQQIAQIAVPARAEQIATLLTLIPFGKDERFRAVELASGEGFLAHAVLSAFPNATLTALDMSDLMRESAAARLAAFGGRAAVAYFDLAVPNWYPHLDGADVVLSSLCVHHLDGAGKQALFAEVARRISPRGSLLLADIVQPQRAEGRNLFAATWDRAAEAQDVEQNGALDVYAQFVEIQWNIFWHPDPFDKPSPLADQLAWLKTAGFAVVDCFWLQAGHAVYGGYKAAGDMNAAGGIDYGEALRTANATLNQG